MSSTFLPEIDTCPFCLIRFIQSQFDAVCQSRILLQTHDHHRTIAVFVQEYRRAGAHDFLLNLGILVSQIGYRANIDHFDPSLLRIRILSQFYHIRESFLFVPKVGHLCPAFQKSAATEIIRPSVLVSRCHVF
jgi:hypothetical protein